MCWNRLCIPGTDRPVNHFGGNDVDSPAKNRLFHRQVGCVSRNRALCHGAGRRKQTPGLMCLNVPVIAVCSAAVPRDRATSTRSRSAIVGMHIEGPPDGNTGLWLRLPNPCAVVSDWSNSSPVQLRPELDRGFPSGTGISWSVSDLQQTRSTSGFPSGSPENRPGLRLSLQPNAYNATCL